MCGIAGIVSSEPLAADVPALVARMRDVLAHRGPDDAGLYCDIFAALGHRRLSIVDIASGHQPLANEDGTIRVVFNGEIYNHAEIRTLLEARGHRYRTRSDTETIVHAYEEWGDRAVDYFRGMFAFAVWDVRCRRLLLARDRLGVKPLYWTRRGDRLLFGSEIKALLASGLFEPEANELVFAEVLGAGAIASASTMFRDVYKLLPGHQLVFEDGRLRVTRYWDLPTARGEGVPPADRAAAAHDAVAHFRSLFEESVRLRLMSDVPLGVFLSGGIDSSAIAAMTARMIDRPVQTFSVAFKDRAFNELSYSREVAQAIGADAHETVIDDRDFFDALPRLVWHEDEPIAHPSSVPLHFVSRLARRHVTVVLTGEGSDELLAGYGRYARSEWNWRAGAVYERLMPDAWRTSIARMLSTVLPSRLARLVQRSFLAKRRAPVPMFFDNFSSMPLAEQRTLLSPSLHARTGEHVYAYALAQFDRPAAHSTLLDRLLYADIKTYLVELLMRQDQMSMAASIESRVPFLDHRLVEFASMLPDHVKRSGLTTKKVLREAMRGILPDRILNRPKQGFPVPFGVWMRDGWNDVARDVLLDRRSVQRGVIEPSAVDRLLRDHAAGAVSAGSQIWSLLNLELWHRTFIDRQGIQTLPEFRAEHSGTHAHSVAEIRPAAAAR